MVQGVEDPLEAYNRGLDHLDYNEPDLAIAAFSDVVRLKPTAGHAWFARGFAYALRGEFEQAIADYTHAIQLDPTNAAAYHNRAAAYREQGQLEKAAADEKTSRELKKGPA